MERLTYRMIDDEYLGKRKNQAEPCEPINVVDEYDKAALSLIVDRLAAYEDAGLSPAEVAEMAKAQDEGRLDIHPCCIGDAVYAITQKQNHYAEDPYYAVEVTQYQKSMLNKINKLVFLGREEAEAALNAQNVTHT